MEAEQEGAENATRGCEPPLSLPLAWMRAIRATPRRKRQLDRRMMPLLRTRGKGGGDAGGWCHELQKAAQGADTGPRDCQRDARMSVVCVARK